MLKNNKISLKAARINANLTQAEAAEKMKVSVNMLWRWEQNPSIVPVKYLKDIEQAYNMPYDNIDFL